MIEILKKLFAVFVSIDRIVQFDSGDSEDDAAAHSLFSVS